MQHNAVKSINAAEGRIGGYLVVWGNPAQRDLQGEYFTHMTELGVDWYPCRPVLYHHGQDTHLKATVIGVIDTLRRDETGLWAEAQLDLRHRYSEAVRRLIDRGVLSWSSGSLPHLVKVAKDGCIEQWPIVEGSLTPAPAEPRRTDVQTIKSAYHALGLDIERLEMGEGEFNMRAWHAMPEPGRNEQQSPIYNDTIQQGEETYMENEINTTMENRRRLPMASGEDATPYATKTRIEINSPYDTLDAMDMLHGYVLLRAAKSFSGVSERYANALAHKIVKSGLAGAKAAGDLSGTTITGFGDDWVPELWSAQIWNKARQDNVLLPLFRSIEMPSNPFEMTTEGADPNVHFVPETTLESQLTLDSGNTIPSSKIGAGKVTLRAGKLALRVGFNSELVEDGIVPVLNIYREQAVRAIADSIDNVLLNGDTETDSSGNVNTDSAAPAATDRFLIFDALRKLPLVTNFANSIDMNGAPTLAKMRETRFKMNSRYATRLSDLAWVVDGGTYAKLLDIEQFLTVDKAGPMATAQTGQIGFIDGIPVYVSGEMPVTNADGFITVGGSNTKGTALCVYRPGWMVGYRRRIAVNVDYLPYFDSYQLTATVRLAFANFDTEVASALYNITV